MSLPPKLTAANASDAIVNVSDAIANETTAGSGFLQVAVFLKVAVFLQVAVFVQSGSVFASSCFGKWESETDVVSSKLEPVPLKIAC